MSKATPTPSSALSKLINSSGAKSASESLAISVVHNLQYQHDWTDLKLHVVQLDRRPYGGPTSDTPRDPALLDLDGLSFHHSNSSSRTASPARSVSSSSGSTTPTLHGDGIAIGTLPPPFLSPDTIPLISGLPPRHSYIHPDLQTHLLKHKINDDDLPVQREFVLPLALGEKFTLSKFCAVFDSLPRRDVVRVLRRPSPTQAAAVPAQSNHDRGSASNCTARTNGSARSIRSASVYEHKDQKRVLLGMRANEGMGGDGTVVYYIMQEGEVKPRQNG